VAGADLAIEGCQGIAVPTVTTAVMRSASPTEAGVASGISNTFRQVGAVFGVATAAAIFAAHCSYRTPTEFVDRYRPALVALGILCVTGILAGAMIPRATSGGTASAQAATSLTPATGADRSQNS
jgi:hypothetical protein